MSFKENNILAQAVILFEEQDGLCNYGKTHHEAHFCEFILNFSQWLRRCFSLKIYFYFYFVDHFVPPI